VAWQIDIKQRKSGRVDVLHDGRIVTQVIPDEKYPGMYRVLANGEFNGLSRMRNLARLERRDDQLFAGAHVNEELPAERLDQLDRSAHAAAA